MAYQKSAGDLNLQVAAYGRYSGVHFTPDPVGDLFFNGVASDVERNLYSGGLQADASYSLGDKHTIARRHDAAGRIPSADATTTVFPMDSTDPSTFNPLPGSPRWTIHNRLARAVRRHVFAG